MRKIRSEDGFTLVELLVVVLCIGILAAMAIPTLLNQRAKAYDAGAKADARNAQVATETLFVGEQTYAALSPAKLKTIETALNNANITAATGTATTYTLTVTSKSNNTFTISRAANGVLTRTCTVAATGACATNASW